MSTAQIYILEVQDTGHNFHDPSWMETDAAYIEQWKSAALIFNKHEFNKGKEIISITSDWRPIIRRCSRSFAVMHEVERARSSGSTARLNKALKNFPRSKIRVKFKAPERGGHSHVESFIHDIYLITNIAAPGMLDLYSAVVKSESGRSRKLSLSNIYFALAALDRNKGRWPQAAFLPIVDVAKWYFKVRTGASQIPHNRMEKVLFALLHLSITVDIGYLDILWP